jgi:hydroxypyruvate reductase
MSLLPAPSWGSLHEHAARLHRAAIGAADPRGAVLRHLRLEEDHLRAGTYDVPLAAGRRLVLLAAGKAAPAMARGALERLGGRVSGRLVVHPRTLAPGAGWPLTFRLLSASHPLPDEGSLAAGEEALRWAEALTAGDVLLVLLSGGASALLEVPRPPLTLEDLCATTRALQHAGADIEELNTVRRALSRVKGGGLLRAAGSARVVTLALSDVVGDRPEAIASGPTVPSPTGPEEALAVLERRGVAGTSRRVVDALTRAPEARGAGVVAGSPSPAEPESPRMHEFSGAPYCVVGSNRIAAEAARGAAESLGFHARIETLALAGEACEAGERAGRLARAVRERGEPAPTPACLLLGGETTVTVRGTGRGGRNLELALGAARAMEGLTRAAVLSFATDGVDGTSDGAGALVTGETIVRARALGLDPDRTLRENDTDPFFRALGDLWVSGPTGTNVNDLTIVLVYP